jgi:hypothetical protein
MGRQNQQLIERLRTRGFITIKEAAVLATIPEVTVRYWCRNELVRGTVVGGNWFVNKASLLERAGIQ